MQQPKSIALIKSILAWLFLFLHFTISAADYFWVGGTGDWSDISHWATTSGGSVKHAQAPTSEDDVFFDANSFTSPGHVVTVNLDIAFFKSMDWTGVTNNPSFVGPESSTLNVFGGFILSPAMDYLFRGETKFTGSGDDKPVDFAGHPSGQVLTFEGDGGWGLSSAVTVDSMFELRRGSLVTNSQDIATRFLYISTDDQKLFDLGNSNITISGAFLDIEYMDDEVDIKSCVINTTNLNFDPGNSRIDFTAKDPAFWYRGGNNIAFNNVIFSSTSGEAILTDRYSDQNILFNSLTLFSSAKIDGRLSIMELNLTGGNVYEFESGGNYKFSTINANGNCARGVIITANESGNHATFEVSSGTVAIDFLTLRDIHAVGGATFTASNAVDLGNNSGWAFTNTESDDFYWIGGTGDWSDPSHWSSASGGAPGGCVPSGKDNVFFDLNSFSAPNQVVTVDRENIYMHDMTWSGVTNSPEFTGDVDFRIRITGSLEMDANMEHTFEGYYHFESAEENNTILMNGNIFNREIYFSGVEGVWSLQDDIEVIWHINLISGALDLNGHKATCLEFLSRGELDRRLTIRNSHLLLRQFDYRYPYYNAENEGFTLQAENSLVEFSGGSAWLSQYGGSSLPNVEFDSVLFNTSEGGIYSDNWMSDEEPSASIAHLIFRGRGSLTGHNKIDILEIAAGEDYSFDGYSGQIQIIDEIISDSDCNVSLTHFYSSVPSRQAEVRLNKDYIFNRFYIRDINFQGGTVTADESHDGGNNTNVSFDQIAARTLYWVGDGGMWQDASHWSLSSGGPGGECVPTILDDVIFDENSFTLNDQQVGSVGVQYRYCNNITWTNTFGNPYIDNWFLIINGDLEYDQSFRNYVWQHQFTSPGEAHMKAGGQMLHWVIAKGEGELIVDEDFTADNLTQQNGILSLNDVNVEVGRMAFEFDVPKETNFGASEVTIFYDGDVNYPPFVNNTFSLTLDPGTSKLNFTGFETGILDKSGLTFYDVEFSNPVGLGWVQSITPWDDEATEGESHFNSLVFSGNGETRGDFTTNNLIGAPGKTYTLHAGRSMVVSEYLQMIGNNCTPIELKSSQADSKADIIMPNQAEVVADFVQMRDIRGSGGADFNAGSRSTDIANSNVGWTFEDTPDFIEAGFLGVDRALCDGEDLELNAYSFSPNEIYTWSDNSSDSILLVTEPGVYFVEVEFQSSCILRDTVEIFDQQDVMASLPTGLELCEGTSIMLDATVPIATAEYTWNNGENTAIIEVTEGGEYAVEIEVDGCISSAMTEIGEVLNPGLDLGMDRSFCDGTIFTLGGDVGAESYTWQDGTTMSELTSTEAGLFWLEIEFNDCTFIDTVEIDYTPLPIVEIGDDITVCDNEANILEVANPDGLDVLWQDGSTENSIEIISEGPYVVILDDEGCSNKDSIFVTINAAPSIDLGEDISECEGVEVFLSVPDPTSDFQWTDGNEDMDRQIESSGTYVLEVSENGCQATDSVSVLFKEIPFLFLGQDTTVCDYSPHTISVLSNSEGEITWEDGSIGTSFTVENSGSYLATIDKDGCSSQDSIQINFRDCIEFNVFIPNSFSPNEDGINDVMEVHFSEGLAIESYEITIFDRWGNRVYSSNVYGEAWDGKFNTQDLDTGVYGYFINLSYIDDFGPGDTVITGDITIIN